MNKRVSLNKEIIELIKNKDLYIKKEYFSFKGKEGIIYNVVLSKFVEYSFEIYLKGERLFVGAKKNKQDFFKYLISIMKNKFGYKDKEELSKRKSILEESLNLKIPENKFSFEKKIINPLLTLIEDNQEYLTNSKNLPQLAKLGYIYNILWYNGRLCWGNNGLLSKSNKSNDCEENPKYKIEMCNPKTKRIENLIYDAWGLHIENSIINWNSFYNIIINGKELTEIERIKMKSNKTLDDWERLYSLDEYPYSKEETQNYILCVIGNGLQLKDGFVEAQASGAKQSLEGYGDWKNAKFKGGIKIEVEKLLALKEVKEVLEVSSKYWLKEQTKEKDPFVDTLRKYIKIHLDSKGIKYNIEELNKYNTILELEDFKNSFFTVEELKAKKTEKESKKKNKKRPIYPIEEDYSIITKLNKTSHLSYIKGAISICEKILNQEDIECKENIDYARKNISKFKKIINKNKKKKLKK